MVGIKNRWEPLSTIYPDDAIEALTAARIYRSQATGHTVQSVLPSPALCACAGKLVTGQ